MLCAAFCERVEEEVAQMCNLSQGIVERGIAQGMERGIAQGVEKGAFNATLASLRRLIANAGMSAEQAMNVLERACSTISVKEVRSMIE